MKTTLILINTLLQTLPLISKELFAEQTFTKKRWGAETGYEEQQKLSMVGGRAQVVEVK